MKTFKNRNNIFGEQHLAHIRIIIVSLGVKLTYVLFYATTELHQRRYVVIFRVFTLFCYWWSYFVICGLCRTIRACWCFFCCLWDYFSCLCLAVGHEWILWYWSFVDMSGYFDTDPLWTWVNNDILFDPSFAGTLTHVKTIETCVESAFAMVCAWSAIADCFLLFWWGRLDWIALHQVT
jgi:hypothetical protein